MAQPEGGIVEAYDWRAIVEFVKGCVRCPVCGYGNCA